ncbi:glutamic acid-rich protein-like isoform X2 [Thalassophryne amazonica]|uniref:glutamic acid-rich protein-like isoform X2 n=1 Tax=Thalassophryne amazonica TaxID=390379 RepID=UPI001471D91C|nr:glutamic acid-rich protein-like isoform X2 [Thalassophryne amazonica]
MFVKASKHELIRLIYRHLKDCGFHSAAQELRKQSAQELTNTSVSLMEIYSSWLNDSRKNTDSVKHGTSPAKEFSFLFLPKTCNHLPATKINTPTSAGASGSDREDLSQSLLPQTPCLTNKKSGHSSPVKPVAAASPFERKLVSTFTHVPVAPDESSDSTDISGKDKNVPSVVKSPRMKHNSTSATSPAQITVPSDVSPTKPKKNKRQHSGKAMKQKQKVKKKKRDSKTADKHIKVKKPKTREKGKKRSSLPTMAAGDEDSDSDSSLDVDKWKKLVLDMTEADIIKMDIINALDSSASPQKKSRVRKPPNEPPTKSDAPAEQNNGTVEKNVKVDDSIMKEMPRKTKKPRKNRTKTSGSVTASLKLKENLITTEDKPCEPGVSPAKQVTKKDKRKSVAFGEENIEEVQSEPKGKKRKTHMGENAKETAEDQREEIYQQSLVSIPVKEKKKKMKNKSEDEITENTSETAVSQEYPEHMKKKKKQTAGEKVGENPTETAEDQREREHMEEKEQNQEVNQQSLLSMPMKEKKKKMKHKPEDETTVENASETIVNQEYPEQMKKKKKDIKDNAEQAVKIKKAKKKKMETEEGDENSEQVKNDDENHTEPKTVEEKTKKKRKKSDHKDASSVETADGKTKNSKCQ